VHVAAVLDAQDMDLVRRLVDAIQDAEVAPPGAP
jgi:hypothetical protein